MGAGRDRLAGPVLERSFFDRPAASVAPDLLGCIVEHQAAEGVVAVRLTEVEAYQGELDPASHAYRGRTPRNAVMFGEPGYVYVYFTYGMHFCMNLVCEGTGTAAAVLLRAGEVVDGAELATRRRGSPPRDLARGPARLTVALGVGRAEYGLDACDPDSPLRVRRARPRTLGRVLAGPRVGISAGAQTPWRFWLDGEPTVSEYRAHVEKRRSAKPSER
jgi:DNA-3-methyladenine glycosylase